MNSFIDAAINRTRTTMLLMLMVVLSGLISYNAIPVENDPHIEVPFFIIEGEQGRADFVRHDFSHGDADLCGQS